MNDIKAGEEVEWEDACSVESAKLQQYTFDMVWLYKQDNGQNSSELQQKAWTPRQPYFQNFWEETKRNKHHERAHTNIYISEEVISHRKRDIDFDRRCYLNKTIESK